MTLSEEKVAEAIEVLSSAVNRINNANIILSGSGVEVEFKIITQHRSGYHDLEIISATIKKVLGRV